MYSIVEENVIRRRRPVRKWRLRGRRGQVSAVATILGLLLVVTYIANYLTTTLPQQMSINDLNHDVQVQDQVGRLQALIQAASSSNAIGAQFTQPITLGGAGQPPFAGADSGWIAPGNSTGGFMVNFTAGPPSMVIGSGPVQDGAAGKAACTAAPPVRCPAGTWFTLAVTPTVADDLLVVVVSVYEESAALTIADVSDTAGSTWNLVTAGGNNVPGPNAVIQYVFWALDANTGLDTTSVGAAGVSAHDGSAILVAIKSVNTGAPISATGTFVTATSTTAHATVVAPAYGLVLGLVSSGLAGSSAFPVITAGSLGTPCTATCTAIASEDGENWGETFAESEPATTAGTYTASATLSISEGWGELALAINPALTTPTGFPISTGAPPPGASLVVHLRNTYTPAAEVAYDQGAVVFAQPGSVPILIDPPAFSFSQSAVTLTIPVFEGTIPVESGLSTTDIALRLLSTDTFQFPGTALTLQTNSHVTLSLQTPYWAAWMAYFLSVSSLAGTFSCKNLAGTPCPSVASAAYQPGGPLATITLSLPATSLDLDVTTFSVSET